MPLYRPAQSLIDLLINLKGQNAPSEVMQDVVLWHDYALTKFAGRVRKCQRMFIPHALGVTDATARFVTLDRDVLAASMFHSIYSMGRFPMPKTHRRADVRSAIGSRAEEMVFAAQSPKLTEEGFRSDLAESFGESLLGALLSHEYEELVMSPPLAGSCRASTPKYAAQLSKISAEHGFDALSEAFAALDVHKMDTAWLSNLIDGRSARQLFPTVTPLGKITYAVKKRLSN